METKGKKRLMNGLMAALIGVIVFCCIMAVGNVRGWFGGDDADAAIRTGTVSGIVNIERDGVGYSLKENVPLKAEDTVETKNGSRLDLNIYDDSVVSMDERSELSVTAANMENIDISLSGGEAFAEVENIRESFRSAFGETGENAAKTEEAVFSMSSRTGSASLNVYEGAVNVIAADGSETTVEAGQTISIARSGDGQLDVSVGELDIAALSQFALERINESERDGLCFTREEAQKILDERNSEKSEAENATAEGGVLASSAGAGAGAGAGGTSSAGSGTSDSGGSGGSGVKSCTIEIRCDTILKNMSDLTAGKDRYVPSNGVILATSAVEFVDGETVFDVLKRVCSYGGIQLEYSYTQMYGSYYIEGINNLYEFDCGQQSGWMYKVNGWFPNYGCSEYVLKDGDTIVWCYTCKGLGTDVGASGFSY